MMGIIEIELVDFLEVASVGSLLQLNWIQVKQVSMKL